MDSFSLTRVSFLFLTNFTAFHRLLLGFTGFYWDLLGFIGYSWVSLALPSFNGFIEFD